MLTKNGWLEPLFRVWFNFFSNYTRVYDRKVTVLGLSSIFLVPCQQWPESIRNSCQHIVVSCLQLLHDAEKLRVEKSMRPQEDPITFADEALVSSIKNVINSKEKHIGGDNSDDDIQASTEIDDSVSAINKTF